MGRARARASAASAAAWACALVLAAGCGASHTSANTTVRPSAVAQADATHEYPSRPPPRQTAARAAPSAVQAIRTFATAYINWNAQTVSARMRALATESVGQASAAMALAAAETADDYELRRGGIANSGTVEAVAPLSGHDNEYVVVTRESTSASSTAAYQGLAPAWHLALATVLELRPGRWVLSGWQPEN